jgi:hypothetical protein
LYGYDAPTLVDLVFGERRAPKDDGLDHRDLEYPQVVERELVDGAKLTEDKCG